MKRAPGGASNLVVVGSSAGGIEAVSAVLSKLPRDFPAAIVVAQHVDPERRSHLKEVLQSKSRLPVVLLDGRGASLDAGTVYVVPSHQDVVVSPGRAALLEGGGGRSQPSVDRLLTTAAEAYGDRLVAVILSGNGSDGASGAVAVKQNGGIVVIQDPRSASHPSMPAALPPTAVDHVSDVEGIPALLGTLVAPPAIREPESEVAAHVARIVDILAQRSTVDFRNYKASTVLRRVERRMATTRIPTVAEYVRHLGAQPDEVAALAQALIIKVTEFFRDPEAFAFLRASILPRILERAGGHGRRLRLWSAGCATGEEAYSLAMIVADALGGAIGDWSVRIFATDLDDGAVTFARRGVYPPAVLENLPEGFRKRFFEEVDGASYRVTRNLRQMVVYGQQDLSRAVAFPKIDLVVCRNLLIYFQPELQQELLDLFAYSLHDTGGYLFLGRAETARPSSGAFEVVNKKWKIYRCLGGPVGFRGAVSRWRAPEPAPPPPAGAEEARGGTVPGRLDDLVLRSMAVGTVVVDRAYRMVFVNPAARRLLGIRDRPAERDFLHSVRDMPYADIRAAIDAVLRDHEPVVLSEVSLGLGDDAVRRHISLAFAPVGDGAGAGSGENVVITVVDATETVAARQRREAAEAGQRKLVDELHATNSRLNEVNRELQDANDELQAANEELMLAQEELQATNEEFEATNEELQATNEELETNNEELQATNEELDTTNDELQARTSELQELAALGSLERERLGEIMARSPFPLVVLRGHPPVVETLNPLFATIVGRTAAAGREVEDVFAGLPAIARGAREAMTDDAVWMSEPTAAPSATPPRLYLFTAIPLHDDGTPSGVAVFAEEVSDRMPEPRPQRRRPGG